MTSDAEKEMAKFCLAQKSLEFTLDLCKQCIADDADNIFISPFSISVALAMTLAGARENTATEMKDVLKLDSFENDTAIHEAFQDIINSFLGAQSADIKLHIANRMYVHNKTNILSHFNNILEKHYNSSSNVVDFEKETEKVRLEINKWVEDQTQTKIKDLIAPEVLNDLTRLVLINAIYFKGDWLQAFDPENTIADNFFLDKKKAIVTDLMHETACFKYSANYNLHCEMLELPYMSEALSMFIILPTEVDGLKNLEESLTASNLNEVMSTMRLGIVIVTLPKFKIESTLSLKEILLSMGMKDLFCPINANLSGITGENELFVSAVLHKAFLEVNEEGSEAAAVTAVDFTTPCSLGRKEITPVFRADHPFLLFIRDNRSGCILFWGRLVYPNPSTKVKKKNYCCNLC